MYSARPPLVPQTVERHLVPDLDLCTVAVAGPLLKQAQLWQTKASTPIAAE